MYCVGGWGRYKACREGKKTLDVQRELERQLVLTETYSMSCYTDLLLVLCWGSAARASGWRSKGPGFKSQGLDSLSSRLVVLLLPPPPLLMLHDSLGWRRWRWPGRLLPSCPAQSSAHSPSTDPSTRGRACSGKGGGEGGGRGGLQRLSIVLAGRWYLPRSTHSHSSLSHAR